jgi:hypothetical protein
MLVIEQIAYADDYDAQAASREELVATLKVPKK